MVKIDLHMKEPMRHKGGLAHDLYKGKGSMALMERYRSILL